MIHRIDPPGCMCTDCQTGYSKPLEAASYKEIKRMIDGDFADATGMASRKVTTIEFDHYHVVWEKAGEFRTAEDRGQR